MTVKNPIIAVLSFDQPGVTFIARHMVAASHPGSTYIQICRNERRGGPLPAFVSAAFSAHRTSPTGLEGVDERATLDSICGPKGAAVVIDVQRAAAGQLVDAMSRESCAHLPLMANKWIIPAGYSIHGAQKAEELIRELARRTPIAASSIYVAPSKYGARVAVDHQGIDAAYRDMAQCFKVNLLPVPIPWMDLSQMEEPESQAAPSCPRGLPVGLATGGGGELQKITLRLIYESIRDIERSSLSNQSPIPVLQ